MAPRQPAGPGTHDGWEDRILSALDGSAAPAARAELETHLAACAPCRAVHAEYRAIFARLREVGDEPERPAAFWEALADDIDRHVALEQAQARPVATAGSASREPAVTSLAAAPGGQAAEGASGAADVVPLRRGWSGVAGGLVAASVAVVVLVGLYLRGPRPDVEPEAFTSPPPAGERVLPGEAGGQLAEGRAGAAPESLASDPASRARAAGTQSVSLDARDPLATLADPAGSLDDLTLPEAEELLRVLEAQT